MENWKNSFKEGLALGLTVKPLPLGDTMTETWETLWEGEKQNAVSGDYGKLLWLWDNQSTTGVNTLSVGDIVRVTVDGTVYVYTVQATRYESTVEAGNKWLGLLSDSSTVIDDGTDFYFFEMYGGLRAYTRTFGTHYVKFERLVREPVAYLCNGVRLPVFPAVDRSVLPYAALVKYHDGSLWAYSVTFFNALGVVPTEPNSLGRYMYYVPEGASYQSYYLMVDEMDIWQELPYTPGIQESDKPFFIRWPEYTDAGVFWSSVDLLNEDGTLYLSASEPVPVFDDTSAPDPVSTETDHKARVQGWLFGRRLAAMRVKREPVAYLYNGVRFPPLPEWDKETYPVAIITPALSISGMEYEIKLGAALKYGTDEDGKYMYGLKTNYYSAYLSADGKSWGDLRYYEWPEKYYIEPLDDSVYTIWTNTDILNEDGTVYLAASEPVPVYE